MGDVLVAARRNGNHVRATPTLVDVETLTEPNGERFVPTEHDADGGFVRGRKREFGPEPDRLLFVVGKIPVPAELPTTMEAVGQPSNERFVQQLVLGQIGRAGTGHERS